eukprot:gene15995-17606_t
MNHARVKLKEEDLLKLILEYLSSRNLHVSMRTLEKETGIVNNSYSDDILFLRELILDGDWDEVLLFVQPFENLDEFDAKQFKYIILKQKFIELLSMKSHIVGKQASNTIEEVMQTLNKLEATCPSKEEYSNLCWLLTVPNLIERSEFKEWTLDNSRLKCFMSALDIIRNVIPFEKKSKRISGCATNGRLLQLIVKGVLYETCIDVCQMKATGHEDEMLEDVSVKANILQGLEDEYSANLLSWLKSLHSDAFNQPFEQLSLDVSVEKATKYSSKPRHSIDFAKEKKGKHFTRPLARSIESFDQRPLSERKLEFQNNPVTSFSKPAHRIHHHQNKEVEVNMFDKCEAEKLQTEVKNNDVIFPMTNNILHKADLNQESGTPNMKLKNTVTTRDDDVVGLIKSRDDHTNNVALKNNHLDTKETDESDVHVEKEKQRAAVLQKLEEYEHRKQQMQDMIARYDKNEETSHHNPPNHELASTKTEEATPEKSRHGEHTPRHTPHTVNLPAGAGRINTSTPKPAKKNAMETPPPEASPVNHVKTTSDLRRFAANKATTTTETKRKKDYENIPQQKTDDMNLVKGKENEPKDNDAARKGPMINGVRRALSSPPLLNQSSDKEEKIQPIETKPTQINKKRLQFGDGADGNDLVSEVQKSKIKQNEQLPKGPGPTIKTRDGNKVYVTELLKSREEIKNAAVCNQNQEIIDKEERAEINKVSHEVEDSNENNKVLSFSPICKLEDSQAIRAVSFHPDGRLFGVGANSKILRICKIDNFNHPTKNSDNVRQASVVFKRTKYHKGSIYCMAWNPLGDIIATGSNDKTIKIMRFDPDNYVQDGIENDLFIHNGTVRELAFMPDKPSMLLSGGAGDGAIQVTDCSTLQTIGTLRGHSGNVMSVYAGDGDIIASGSTDNTLRLWDLRSHRCIDVILVGDSSPASVALSQDGSFLASGQEDGCILLYDISAGRTMQSFRLHQEDCRSVRFSSDSNYLLTGSYDASISLLHVTGSLESTVPKHYQVACHKDKVIQCRWHPSKYAFLSSSADRTTILWNSDVQSNQYHL